MKILMNPTPDGGGGEGGGSQPDPALQRPPASEPGGTPAGGPESLTLPRSEVERLYGAARLIEQLQTQSQESARKTAEAEAMAAAAKGQNEQLQKLLADRDAQSAKIRDAWLGEALDRVVASTLAGKAWVSEDATRHAAHILRGDLESVLGDDGRPIVRDRKTGRPAVDVISERLGSAEFAHYLKAPNQGGSGATNRQGSSSGSASPPVEEFNFNPFGRPVEGGEGFIGAFRRRA